MNVKEDFLKDVLEGLANNPKKLSSKYFYNETGDRLFHYIMAQPEYYLTCAEHEILQRFSGDMLSRISADGTLRIIEPGAGDGMKTRVLLEAVLDAKIPVIYNPVDISPNVLKILCNSMVNNYPQLICEPVVADYMNLSGKLPDDQSRKLILFLGSNLGNFTEEESIRLIQNFVSGMRQGDYFLLGVDLVKDPNRILAAYNDARGVTAEFNFNLLTRINLELDANFRLENFMHFPVYNPVLQRAESYLISKIWQEVTVSGKTFRFSSWEPMLTEISRKFTIYGIEQLANFSGFKILNHYRDMNNDFACSLWEKI